MFLMAKFFQTGRMVLVAGLGVSLAAWSGAAGTHRAPLHLSGHDGGANQRLQNSATNAGPSDVRPDLVIVEAPQLRPGPLPQRFPQGSRLVKLASAGGAAETLTPDFFAAADPRISFDGAKVLFAGKKTADAAWQIWEMNVDGRDARQLTHGTDDCLKPAYLPRGEIVYTVFTPAPGAPAGAVTSQLWVARIDGSNPHAITFAPGDFEVETVLQNGGILATARSPLLPAHGVPADRELYTLKSDGSGLTAFRCDHQNPALRRQASEMADGAVVFVKAPLGSTGAGGELAWIRRGALHNAPLAAAPTVALAPQPLGADELLVARGAGAGAKKLSMYLFDPEQRKFVRPVYDNPKASAVEAVPVAAHEPPRWYWSTLNPDLHRGYFICLDANRTGEVPKSAVKMARVRVLAFDAATGRESALGEGPIETDGSFYLALPPDRPVRFEVLDATGRVVRAQRSWIWTRSGEEHGCVGCHEDPAVAPANRWPLALRRLEGPTRLGVGK
jgi:hypothetical protein